MAISTAGQIAVAWTYQSTSSLGVRVATLEGGEWKQLGPDLALTGGRDPRPQIAFQPDGTLLLKTEDDPPSGGAGAVIVVRRWTGTAWEELGGPNGPMGAVQTISMAQMALDSLGAPVIAAAPTDTILALRRWDGVAWAPLSSGDWAPADERPRLSDFALDSSDRPVLLYETVRSSDYNDVSNLVRWDGSAWTHPANTPTSIIDLALGPNDAPVGLLERAPVNGKEIALMGFDGAGWTSWTPITVIDADAIGSEVLGVDATGGITVAWKQVRRPGLLGGASSNVYAQRWAGGSWIPVLGPSSAGNKSSIFNIQLAFGGPYQGEPVVAWTGFAPDASGTLRAHVFVRMPNLLAE